MCAQACVCAGVCVCGRVCVCACVCVYEFVCDNLNQNALINVCKCKLPPLLMPCTLPRESCERPLPTVTGLSPE